MNPDPHAAIILALMSAITTIVLAYFKLQSDLRKTHEIVNGRMGELLELTKVAATAKAKVRRRRAPRAQPPLAV